MDAIRDNRRTSAYLLTGFALVHFAVIAVLGLVLGQAIVGVAVGAVVAGVVAKFTPQWADGAALRTCDAVVAESGRYQRLHNLVEGLCIANGVPKPAVHVVESPALDACATGRDPKHASLVVTTGLLEHLDRVQLEGVVAHELAHVRRYDTRTGVLAGFVLGAAWKGLAQWSPLRRWRQSVIGEERELLADALACQMTRYPPGLLGAVRTMAEDGSRVGRPSAFDHLWAGRSGASAAALGTRIEMLREG